MAVQHQPPDMNDDGRESRIERKEVNSNQRCRMPVARATSLGMGSGILRASGVEYKRYSGASFLKRCSGAVRKRSGRRVGDSRSEVRASEMLVRRRGLRELPVQEALDPEAQFA